MKKYLMTGMAALAICAAFTSCSKGTDLYNEDVINENTVQDIINNYNEAFIKHFGQPAANQDWGFSDKASTRANTYMNGNMEKYYDAPLKGANEETDVEAYVHSLTELPAKAAPAWETYFVTQIHDGNETYNTQPSKDPGVSYVGGKQMDELAIAMVADAVINADGSLRKNKEDDWIHINNFNNANNTDWNGNTLVENGGTFDFAYKSSADSKYHNRWIGIDGKDVPNSQGVKGDYKDYYYICFDFEATGGPNTQTNFSVKWTDESGNHDVNVNNVPGYWTVESATAAKLVLDVNGTEVVVGTAGYTFTVTQTVGGNMVSDGNNDYTDWIIRLYKAKEKSGADLRIICEDLSAGEDDDDFDFNDVVIDVYYGEKGQAKAKILAAGGTLELRVDATEEHNNEVHDLFSEANNKIDCTGKMINTNGTNSADANVRSLSLDGLTAPEITLSKEVKTLAQARDNIKIEVFKGGKWIELEAVVGKVASKVRVGTDYLWKDERQYIGDEFKAFVDGTASADEWYQNQ